MTTEAQERLAEATRARATEIAKDQQWFRENVLDIVRKMRGRGYDSTFIAKALMTLSVAVNYEIPVP